MHLSVKILAFSILLVVIGYYTVLGIRYLRGQFQYSVLFPGRYIFPKRIKNEILHSLVSLFRYYRIINLLRLEEELNQHLEKQSIITIDNSVNSKEFYQYKISLGENSFRYFLYLYEACVICGLSRDSLRYAVNIETAQAHIRQLNKLVMSRYLKRFISNTDRSIVLAEILHRIIAKMTSDEMYLPYNYQFYNAISREAIIAKYETLVEQACQDGDVLFAVRKFRYSSSPVYKVTGLTHDLMFTVKVCLLTNWLKK